MLGDLERSACSVVDNITLSSSSIMPPEYLVYAAVMNVRLADATLHLYTCDTRLAFLAWVNARQDVFDLPNHLQ